MDDLVFRESTELSKELGVQYMAARLSGYEARELYCIISDECVVVCCESDLRELVGMSPEEVVDDFRYLLGMESREGVLRTYKCTEGEMKMGWINPPKEVDMAIDRMRGEIGNRIIGSEVMKC